MNTKRALGLVGLVVVSLAILAPVVPVVAFALLGVFALAAPVLVLAAPLALLGLVAFALRPAREDLPVAAAGGPRLGSPLPSTSRA
jgi:hypothetical protein